jgi:hypothetical protein
MLCPPLRRPDVVFLSHPVRERPPLEATSAWQRRAGVVAADQDCGLLVLDASWRWASRWSAVADVPPRSLHGYRTATRACRSWAPTG